MDPMKEKIEQLKTLLGEISDLTTTFGLLSWDQQVNMPPGGAEIRANQMATLGRITHDLEISPELGRLLDALKPQAETLDPDSDDARLVRLAARDFEKAVRVPSDYVAEFNQATALAFQAWAEARQKSDFAIFRPHLEKIVELTRRYIAFFPPADHPYDVLLDKFEPGMKTAEVKAIFDAIRPRQVALIKAISQKPQVEDSFLRQPFDGEKQWGFGVEVITRYGYDWSRGRQDKSAHPFTIGFGSRDVRITTRVDPNSLGDMLFSTLHECGHALYDQGIAPDLERTSLWKVTSLGLHESQSRLWENLVGRSLPFWEHYYPQLRERFPQLGKVKLEQFYRGINKVQPSLIRVDADEATYNLHVMLRMEIEIALMEGKVEVRDLPGYWNARMQEYLGVTPPDDARGVLQDVHWSDGSFGYFPTYVLGNLISVQLWEKLRGDIPGLEEQIRAGKFDALLGWLREKIHRHGNKFEAQELVQRVTGSKIDPEPYLRYLSQKYGEIYGL
jgi:carboxypeptidase Taq